MVAATEALTSADFHMTILSYIPDTKVNKMTYYTAKLLISKAKERGRESQGRSQMINLLVKDTAFKSRPKRRFSIYQTYDLFVWNVSSANSQKLIERFDLRNEDADERLARYIAA